MTYHFQEDEDSQSLHDKEQFVISSDITPTSKSTEEKGEDTEPSLTFNTQKASKRASKTVQKIENKRQGVEEAQRNDLFEDIEFSLINGSSDFRKKRKATKENGEDLFCKSMAADMKEIPIYVSAKIK